MECNVIWKKIDELDGLRGIYSDNMLMKQSIVSDVNRQQKKLFITVLNRNI